MFLLEMILLLQLVHYNVDGKHYLVETADENNSLEENSPGGGQVTAFVSDQKYKSIRKKRMKNKAFGSTLKEELDINVSCQYLIICFWHRIIN